MWTLDLFEQTHLADADAEGLFPATKEEIIEFAARNGAPRAAISILNELEEGEYSDIDEIWPDRPLLGDICNYDDI